MLSPNTSTCIDEIERFQSACWLSPPEAMWRIYSFPLNEMHPSVMTLQVHLPNEQFISFKKIDNLGNVIKKINFQQRQCLLNSSI